MSLQVKSTHFIGKTVHYHKEISSTNETAKQLVAKNEPAHGTVILADYQEQGRGQAGNHWESAPGKNLLTSIILQPQSLPIQKQFLINMLVSVSIAETVQQLVKAGVQIKWPNDILIDGRKVCGILIENFLRGKYISHLITGIGLNVNQVHFHSSIKNSVTSLKLETGMDHSVKDIAERLFLRIENWLEKFNANEEGAIKRMYFSKLYQYQEEKNYRVNGETVAGEIIGVNEQGNLQVRIGNELKSFANKEIEFL